MCLFLGRCEQMCPHRPNDRQTKWSNQSHVGEPMSWLGLLEGARKVWYITPQKPIPGWAMPHESCIPGALCTTCRQLDRQESLFLRPGAWPESVAIVCFFHKGGNGLRWGWALQILLAQKLPETCDLFTPWVLEPPLLILEGMFQFRGSCYSASPIFPFIKLLEFSVSPSIFLYFTSLFYQQQPASVLTSPWRLTLGD